MRRAGLAVVMLLLVASGASAAVIDVPGDHTTIQAAIDAASDGDTVQVAAGTYYENLVWETSSIALIGAGAAVTTVDGGGAGSCLVMRDVPGPARVEGFTFTGGTGAPEGYGGNPVGGGLYVYKSSVTIARNIVIGNSALGDGYGQGGGINVFGYGAYLGFHVTLSDNVVEANVADWWGGGVLIRQCSATLEDNVVRGNSAVHTRWGGNNGGGIMMVLCPDSVIVRNQITDNDCPMEWPGGVGGGLDATRSGLTVRDNVFARNSAQYAGGVRLRDCLGTFSANTVAENTAFIRGAGMELWHSAMDVIDNTFVGNRFSRTGQHGAGLVLGGDCSATLAAGNLIHGNEAHRGSGLYVMSSLPATLTNNTITGNQGGGLYNESAAGGPVITNCILWGNTGSDDDLAGAPCTVTHCDIGTGFTSGPGNISGDPQFRDPLAADYRLRGSSPCIDTGDNSAPGLPVFDKDGTPRIVNGVVDMGAYESPANSPPIADAGGDRTIEADAIGGANVTLDASGSSDPDDGPLIHTWSEAGAVIAGPSSDPTADVSLSLGTHTIELTVEDDGGASDTAVVVITVEDTTAPNIEIAGDHTYEQESPEGTVVSAYDVTVADVCDETPTVVYDPGEGTTHPKGSHTVTVTATDASGNAATAELTLIVQDTTAPTIAAPVDIVVSEGDPILGTLVDLGSPVIDDVADPSPEITNDAPDRFPIGTTTVTWTATDASGNSASAQQSVTVEPGSPENQLSMLRALISGKVGSGNIDAQLEQPLLAKVDGAIAALERGNRNDAKVALNELKALVNQVEAQSGNKIDPATATEIIERANAIIAALEEMLATAGSTGSVGATITAASATPTPIGAQIMFTLSGPGQVSVRVLNLAGRPVKHVAAHRACPEGQNTLLWNTMSDTGLKAPMGTYLVTIESHSADGSASRAIVPVRLQP